jgi:hypothetical protein
MTGSAISATSPNRSARYNHWVPSKKHAKKKHPCPRGLSVSLYPLTPDQAMGAAVLAIKPDDVKRILASKPGKKK